jgi:hypothetical protein
MKGGDGGHEVVPRDPRTVETRSGVCGVKQTGNE